MRANWMVALSVGWGLCGLQLGCGGSIAGDSEGIGPNGAKDSTARVEGRVVYGADGRTEARNADPALREAAESVAILTTDAHYRVDSSTGQVTFVGARLRDQRVMSGVAGVPAAQQNWTVCDDEPFANQRSGGFCSAFLIGPTRMVTAAHCVDWLGTAQDFCKNVRVVFNHQIGANGQLEPVQRDDIFYCAGLLKYTHANGLDFAVFELDRDTGRPGLLIDPEAHKHLTKRAPLAVIGHPDGLPKKVDAGGEVRSLNPSGSNASIPPYFRADLDTFHGNSGSPILSLSTGRVVGILVAGETDWAADPVHKCWRVNTLDMGKGRGEDGVYIPNLGKWLDAYENNDSLTTAPHLPLRASHTSGLFPGVSAGTNRVFRFDNAGEESLAYLHSGPNNDVDIFAVDTYEGDRVMAWIWFDSGKADLDLRVLDENGKVLGSSTGTSAQEKVIVDVKAPNQLPTVVFPSQPIALPSLPGSGGVVDVDPPKPRTVYVRVNRYSGSPVKYFMVVEVLPQPTSQGTSQWLTCGTASNATCPAGQTCVPRTPIGVIFSKSDGLCM